MLKFKYLKLIFVVLLIGVFGHLFAQKVVLDTTQMLVGDQIGITFSISPKVGNEILFPEFDGTLIDGIEIISANPLDTAKNGDLQQKYVITSFEDSVFNIAPFAFIIDNDTTLTNPLILKVSYLQPDSLLMARIDTTQAIPLLDIKPQIQTPWTFKEFWDLYGNYVLISLLILALIAVAIYFYIRHKRNKPVEVKPIPKIPPHVTALEKLSVLKEKRLWQQDRYKDYHSELTEILRTYLEERFSIPAMEYTADQILQSVQRTPMPVEAKQKLYNIFPLADLVKFAKLVPLAHENDLSLQHAFEFIKLMKPETPKSDLNTAESEPINDEKPILS